MNKYYSNTFFVANTFFSISKIWAVYICRLQALIDRSNLTSLARLLPVGNAAFVRQETQLVFYSGNSYKYTYYA